ncbi:MAG: hypothetical protein ACM3ZS_05660 [Nitrososphaerota archaeon]
MVTIGTQAIYAQIPDKDHGASGLTPKEDPQGPGWMPNGAEEDAPGIEANRPIPCPNCADDLSPGSEGLESGIIGPD